MNENTSENAENTQPIDAPAEVKTESTTTAMDVDKEFKKAVAQVRGKKPEAEPVAATTEKPKAEAPKPEGKSEIGDEAQKKGEPEKPYKRNRDNRRWNELTKTLHEREKEIAQLRSQLESKPKAKERESYTTDEEYIKDIAKQNATEEYLNLQLNTLQQRQVQELREQWNEQVKELPNPEQFNASVKQALTSGMIDQHTEEYVMSSPVGAKMLNVFLQKLQQQGFAEMWASMPAVKKGVHLYDLEQRVQRDATQTQQGQQPVIQPKQQPAVPSIAPTKGDKAPGTFGTVESEFQNQLKKIRANLR